MTAPTHPAQVCRLPGGGRVDRERPVSFRFNGRQYTGLQGDTLASALLANDVHVLARSWKYHRLRGLVGSGAEEPNALVQLGRGDRTVPNARATQVELYEGLQAASVNCWPSLEHDLLAVNGLLSPLLPAGFYYKTFMWSPALWHLAERWIRRAAGLGRAPLAPDPDTYVRQNLHCDVLVVGAGPAGLAAALAAGRAGARVVLADEQAEPGGSLLGSTVRLDGAPAVDWVRSCLTELAELPEVRVLARATVFGYHDHNFLTVAERLTDHLPEDCRRGPRERLWRVRARQVVIATGAIERPLVFGNNDLPGVMLASAVSTYVNRYAVRPGRRAVVFTSDDAAYATALDLQRAGVTVAALVDARPVGDSARARALREAGVEVLGESVVCQARGRRRLESVRVAPLGADGRTLAGAPWTLECDLLAMCGGWSPAVHLQAQSGARPQWDPQRLCFLPGPPAEGQWSAGACNGAFELSQCLQEGARAGAEAAARCGFQGAGSPPLPATEEPARTPGRALWQVPGLTGSGRGPKRFVDFQNDVTAEDVALAAREGYESVEHLKRYTTLGFGTDQGKLGNVNGLAILSQVLDRPIAATGTTTFRPNYTPVSFGAIAGQDVGALFEPVRLTALHPAHVALGAVFEDVGQWKRPRYYPRAGEPLEQAVRRECLAARSALALLDASTLGKIDIQGPDALELLERVYTNGWRSLQVGQCRYGLMLREDGMVMDDGVTSRLGEQHYLMTTTTGGAARVYAWLERWLQTEWPQLRVWLTSVTDHWSTVAVVGPRARELLALLTEGVDLSREAFPFMTWREARVAGVPARVFRISFSGELAYEVNVSSHHGLHLWEALCEAGAPLGVTPYGTETMHVLRAEKGYILVGQETDGSQTPGDLGLERLVSGSKDFIGRRSLARADTARSDRKQLVGLLAADPGQVLPEGAQLTAEARPPSPQATTGHVTSSYFSAALGRSIALGLLADGRARHGRTVYASLDDGSRVPALVTRPVFFDPEGGRLHA